MSRKRGKTTKRGRPVLVRFFLGGEDELIRKIAESEGRRPLSDMVRVLALAEAQRRATAEAERPVETAVA
jgi:hypothetical protein